MHDFLRRLRALVTKEMKQLLRDRSSLLIGIVIPLMLLFLIGYGLSMDVKHLPTAVVLEDNSADKQPARLGIYFSHLCDQYAGGGAADATAQGGCHFSRTA